jgi:beta-N-acetylhexosaminidase
MEPFLQSGGCSILVGESRQEYVSRRMSADRLGNETPLIFKDCIRRLQGSCSKLIVAVDEEMGGIRRLEGLVPPLPSLAEARLMDALELEGRCFANAEAARKLGVTMYLAPIADVVDGTNAWLAGRTLGVNPDEISLLIAAYIRGIQRAGVAAVTKHFPGFNDISGDPALVDVTLQTSRAQLLENAVPFHAAIAAGTVGVMAGPAPVASIDRENAACTSKGVVELLRGRFNFGGLIVSDDLDAPATMRGRTLIDTAVLSLNAGVDLLLVAGGAHLEALCDGVVQATEQGMLSAERLSDAANRVRAVAEMS